MDPVKIRTGVIAGALAVGVAGVLLLVSGLSDIDAPAGRQPVRAPSHVPGGAARPALPDAQPGEATGATEAQPGWTHRELLAHLRSKGLHFVSTDPPGGMTNQPAL